MLLFLCFGIDLGTVIEELLSVNILYCICNSAGCIFIAGYSGDASIGYFRVLHEQQVYCSEKLTSIAYMPLSTSGPNFANIYIYNYSILRCTSLPNHYTTADYDFGSQCMQANKITA